MKALEFESRLNDDGTLSVPPQVAVQLAPGKPVRILILVDEVGEDEEWNQFTALEFAKGYADSDAVYDDLSPR